MVRASARPPLLTCNFHQTTYSPFLNHLVGEKKGGTLNAGAEMVGEGQREAAKILWIFESHFSPSQT